MIFLKAATFYKHRLHHFLPLHYRQRPNPDELMDQAIAGNERARADSDMAAQQSAIGHNNVIAHVAVVAHVTTRHVESVRANHGIFLRLVGAVERDVFAEDVV